MTPPEPKNRKYSFAWPFFTGIVILYTIIYLGIASWYLSTARENDRINLQNHSKVVSHDLWILNNSGMQAYLDLAARTDHYKFIEILTVENDLFFNHTGPHQSTIDEALTRLGIISIDSISTPIYYDQEMIGLFQGEKYDRKIYPLSAIFLIQFFIALTLLFIFYLIFNRRLLEQLVYERTRKFQELVNLLPEMIIETNAAGTITFANENAQERLGISNLEMLGFDYRDFILLEGGERIDSINFLNPGRKTLNRKEYRVRDKNGLLFPVIVRSAPIYTADQFAGSRIVIVDITERSALEEQLNRDQKMKSIGMMAGGVAHDLNNILSGIVNYSELMLHEIPEDSPLKRYIAPMKDAGLRAAAVVTDLLTVARGVAAAKENTPLSNIIKDYTGSPEFIRLKSFYPDITYETALAPSGDYITCSVIHVRKCLMNLVTNASEAVNGQGKVSIETKNVQVDVNIKTSHGTITPGTYVVLIVKDSGEGIASYELEHIFEPFYSKKELGRSGTGLGLTIVWNTVMDHGGTVKVNSSPHGTCFELYFPHSSGESEEVNTPQPLETFSGNGQTILVIDDEFQQRDIATQLLKSLGYSVESVSTGEAAIEFLQDKKADLVLLDMILESGMNGLEIYREIIKIHPKQKALIMSGFSESADVKNTIQLGAGGFLNKPYTKEQLARAVFKQLSNRN